MLNRNLKITGATLLSVEEAENLLTREERSCEHWWWLRSPGGYGNRAAYVYSFGDVYYRGFIVSYGSHCVRPALQISVLKSSNLKNC